MATQKNKGLNAQFEKFASAVTKITGSSISFFLAVFIIIVWAITGPLFNFSDTWQLVINTGTTIVTFLMVFVIQQTQNKDSMALQLKLNELIACEEKASNRLIDIEDLSQEELETIKKFYIKLATLAKKEQDLHTSHSVDEANDQHAQKLMTRKERAAHPRSK
jgi:low affinity Fe/Cu permease